MSSNTAPKNISETTADEAAINQQFDAYQAHVTKNITIDVAHKLDFITLGICDEAGEFAGKVKKWVRGDFALTPETRELMAKELGDIMWYIARAASLLDYKFSDVVRLNNEKLSKRRTENKIRGDGDTR